jgi:glycosidase
MKKIILMFAFFTMLWSCDENEFAPKNGPTKEVLAVQGEWDGVKRGEVYYEIFVRSFASGDGNSQYGDLKGITDKLDYLHELGISGIWLTPIFPTGSVHGYDVTNYKSIASNIGTMADFEALMTKANQLNIKVVLDFVINHTSNNHPWFIEARKTANLNTDWRNFYLFASRGGEQAAIEAGQVPSISVYNSGDWRNITGSGNTTNYRYYGMFSASMPDINPECTAIMDSIYDAAKFWLDKGVAGFRLDAAKHIYQIERSQQNIDFWRAFHEKLKTFKPDVYLIGEVLDGTDMVGYYYQGLPTLFDFESWYKLEYAVNNHTGQYYPQEIISYLTTFASYNPNFQHVVKLSNHDEDRAMSKLSNDVEKAKMCAAVMLTMPGQVYMYYGEEIGMLGMKEWSGGDDNVREPFLWAPKGEDTYRATWRNPASNGNIDANVTPLSIQQADDNSLYSTYAKFIRLRNTYPALAEGALSVYEWANLNPQLMIYSRQITEQRMMIIHNLGVEETIYILPEKVSRLVLSHNGAIMKENDGAQYVQMPSMSSAVLEY